MARHRRARRRADFAREVAPAVRLRAVGPFLLPVLEEDRTATGRMRSNRPLVECDDPMRQAGRADAGQQDRPRIDLWIWPEPVGPRVESIRRET